jgi:hypothetical protein
MWLLIVEALAALALLVFIVWWTMFAGRRRGERTPEPPNSGKAGEPAGEPPSRSDSPPGGSR